MEISDIADRIERARELAQISSFWKLCDEVDISKVLDEYAGILERLAECRKHIIPHKRDTDILDYILTGKMEQKNER